MSLTLTLVVLQVMVIAGSLIVGRLGTSGNARSNDARGPSVAARVARMVDVTVIDNVLNGAGLVVRGWSVMLRRLPTGARWQLVAALSAVVSALGYFLWR